MGLTVVRGADSVAELERQQRKLVATLIGMDADIVGLVELENTSDASLRAIVSAINASGDTYAFIDTGIIGDDAIKVGIIYRPDSVSPIGNFAILDQSVDGRLSTARTDRFLLKHSHRLTAAQSRLL